MRKLIYFLLILFVAGGCGEAFADSSVSQAWASVNKEVMVLTMAWTADANSGDVSATVSEADIDGYIFQVVTNPGTTAPSDNYDITINDASGVDIMGGELDNRDTANSEQVVPKIDAVYGTRMVDGAITVNFSGNSVNSATGEVIIYYYKYGR